MFCRQCGGEILEGAAFCGSCGKLVQTEPAQDAPMQFESSYYTPPALQSDAQVHSDSNLPDGGNTITPQYPMKWYNFLVCFSLIAGGILNCLSSLSYFTGSIYTSQLGLDMYAVERLYSLYPALQVIDVLYGVFAIVVGVLQFIARSKLKGFEEDGPKTLYAVYGAIIVGSIVYKLLVCMTLGVAFSSVLGDIIGSVIAPGVLLWCNVVYFNKRAYLFIN